MKNIKNKIHIGMLSVVKILKENFDHDTYLIRNNQSGNIITISEVDAKILYEDMKLK